MKIIEDLALWMFFNGHMGPEELEHIYDDVLKTVMPEDVAYGVWRRKNPRTDDSVGLIEQLEADLQKEADAMRIRRLRRRGKARRSLRA